MSLQNNNLDIGPNAGEDKLRRLFYYESILASGAVVPELNNLANEDVEKIYWRLVNEGIIKLNVTTTSVEPALPSRLSDASLDAKYATNTALTNGLSGKEPSFAAGLVGQYLRGDKSWQTLNKSAVGLANVDNTSDANKPISTATQAALDAKANDDGLFKGTLGRKFRVIAGTIRNTGTGWEVLNDTGHRPTGVTGVTVTSTAIVVSFASTLKVVSFVCGPDETYASRGLRVGASVGLSSANVMCYQEDEHAISDFVSWNGTAWSSLEGVFTGISFASSVVTLNHESMGTTRLYANVSARPPSNAAANTVASIGSLGDTQTFVELRTPAGATITTLSNPTRLWVERKGLRKVTAVDPATLTEASGNIWFVGVVED